MSLLSRGLARAQRKFNYLRDDIQFAAGLRNDLFKRSAGAGRIITYHGICLRDHTRFNASFLTRDTFEKHLQFYKRHFHVLSLDDYYEKKFAADRFNVCLTFDDGLQNNIRYALPLLEKYEIPATFFITGIRDAGFDILWNDFLALFSRYGPGRLTYKQEQFQKNRWHKYISKEDGTMLQDRIRNGGFELKSEMMELLGKVANVKARAADKDFWLQMTEEEITDLSQSPFATVGAHGYYHNDLITLNIKAASEELQACKRYLEGLTRKEVKALAFPYGSYDSAVKATAKAAGFKQLLALDHILKEEDRNDSTILERFVVNPYISVNNQMLANLSGKYY